MIRRDSTKESVLQALLVNPESREYEVTPAVRQQARQIRQMFVTRYGWDVDSLAKYRFRDLALIATEGEVVPALLRGGEHLLELGGAESVLKTMKGMTNAEAKAYAQIRLGLGTQVQDVLREKSLLLNDREWERLEKLAQHYSGVGRRKRRDDRRWLGATLLEMLERAYGGQGG